MVEIGRLCFKNKTEAKKFFSEILNRNEIGSELSGDDFTHVKSLIEHHHNAVEKIGSGIEKIGVRRTKWGNSHRFVIIQTNGEEVALSYNTCLDGKTDSRKKFVSACRRHVHKDLHRWKVKQIVQPKSEGMLKCVESGELIEFEEGQVDHKPPLTFSVIVKAFVQARKMNTDQVAFVTDKDGMERLADEEVIADFREFHKEMAVLRILSKSANLKGSSKGRIAPTKNDGTLESFQLK